MFTYLQKILGKPIKYYEMLMQSKSERVSITQKDIDRVYKQLKPEELKTIVYTEKREEYNSVLSDYVQEIPLNKKGTPMSFKGSFILNDQLLTLFIDNKLPLNDSKKYRLIVDKVDERHEDVKKITEKQKNILSRSLPIWEEIIHRFPSIHKLIVSINNEHPWTLYKHTTRFLKKTEYALYIGGYPQWRINNIDFRKLKPLIFLMEYRQNDKNFSVYFFENRTTKAIEYFTQKD